MCTSVRPPRNPSRSTRMRSRPHSATRHAGDGTCRVTACGLSRSNSSATSSGTSRATAPCFSKAGPASENRSPISLPSFPSRSDAVEAIQTTKGRHPRSRLSSRHEPSSSKINFCTTTSPPPRGSSVIPSCGPSRSRAARTTSASGACANRCSPRATSAVDPRGGSTGLRGAAGVRAHAPHGEIGALPGALLMRPPALRDLLRRAVASRAEQCSRARSAPARRGCPFGLRRAALAQAQLVVANHDLLLRWPPDYPNITHAIVDEAHELTGVADEVYAVEVRPAGMCWSASTISSAGKARAVTAATRPGARLQRRGARTCSNERRGIQQELGALARALAAACE